MKNKHRHSVGAALTLVAAAAFAPLPIALGPPTSTDSCTPGEDGCVCVKAPTAGPFTEQGPPPKSGITCLKNRPSSNPIP